MIRSGIMSPENAALNSDPTALSFPINAIRKLGGSGGAPTGPPGTRVRAA
jgi:hypothetical protein